MRSTGSPATTRRIWPGTRAAGRTPLGGGISCSRNDRGGAAGTVGGGATGARAFCERPPLSQPATPAAKATASSAVAVTRRPARERPRKPGVNGRKLSSGRDERPRFADRRHEVRRHVGRRRRPHPERGKADRQRQGGGQPRGRGGMLSAAVAQLADRALARDTTSCRARHQRGDGRRRARRVGRDRAIHAGRGRPHRERARPRAPSRRW